MYRLVGTGTRTPTKFDTAVVPVLVPVIRSTAKFSIRYQTGTKFSTYLNNVDRYQNLNLNFRKYAGYVIRMCYLPVSRF